MDGSLSRQRVLIVNADDFGRSPGINAGVVRAHTAGIVTSASLMVRWPSAAGAVRMARSLPHLSLGLHLDLGEWAFRDGQWQPLYEVAPTGDADAIAREVSAQLSRFRELVGRDPTHVDSHQHMHRAEPVRSILAAAARELGVPLRDCHLNIHHCGTFYGQTSKGHPYPAAITVDGLLALLAALPPGITELGCHPGIGDDLDSVYCGERATEVETLCDPRVRSSIAAAHIRLRSFGNLQVGLQPWRSQDSGQ